MAPRGRSVTLGIDIAAQPPTPAIVVLFDSDHPPVGDVEAALVSALQSVGLRHVSISYPEGWLT